METEIESALNRVEIMPDGEVRVRRARKYRDRDGIERIEWHRASYAPGNALPADVAHAIDDLAASRPGPAKQITAANPAAEFLEHARASGKVVPAPPKE